MLRKEIENFKSECNRGVLNKRPDIDILNMFGLDKEHFISSFEQLCVRWWDNITSMPDCEGKRLVQCTLLKDLKNCLYASIITDNLELFNQYYEEKNTILIFELCCLCGAEKIIRDLLRKDNSCLLESRNAIAYLASSGKLYFTLELASLSKNLGRKDPGSLLSYSTNNLLFSKKILDIFGSPYSKLPISAPLLKHQEKNNSLKRKVEEAIEASTVLINLIKNIDKQQLDIIYTTIAEHHSKLSTSQATDKLTQRFS